MPLHLRWCIHAVGRDQKCVFAPSPFSSCSLVDISCLVDKTIVAVVANTTIVPVRGITERFRPVVEGMIEFALASLLLDHWTLNGKKEVQFVARYGHRVETSLKYKYDRTTSRDAFVKYIESLNAHSKRPQYTRVTPADIMFALSDPLGERVMEFQAIESPPCARLLARGLACLDVEQKYEQTFGYETYTGRPVGKPSFVWDDELVRNEELWRHPPKNLIPAIDLLVPEDAGDEPVDDHLSAADDARGDKNDAREDTDDGGRGDLFAGGYDGAFDDEMEVAVPPPVLPPPAPTSSTRKRARSEDTTDDVPRDRPAPPSQDVALSLPLPRPRYPSSAPRSTSRLAHSLSEGSTGSGWGLSGLNISGTPAEPIVISPNLAPFAGISDPTRLRELAVERWAVLCQHVTFIQRLAHDIVQISAQEETQTHQPFGAALPGLAPPPRFMPRGGARTRADLPSVSRAYSRAIDTIFDAADPSSAPDVEMSERSPPRAGPSGTRRSPSHAV